MEVAPALERLALMEVALTLERLALMEVAQAQKLRLSLQ